MKTTKFEIGQTYKGVSGVGECAIKIVKRTEKSVWVDTVMEKGKRLKIRQFGAGYEAISYRSWLATSERIYTREEQLNDLHYAAYYR